jgi:PAT family beta-lactamase induction signal transducer AmpG
MLFLGFSAGLPLLLILGTLSFWLREAGIDRSTIGYLTWVGLIYAGKWVWAPLVDRVPIPILGKLLGRRRSWLICAQALIVMGLLGMASLDPKVAITPVVWCALLVAFGSATQDIALDAFRIESADSDRQAALAAPTKPVTALRSFGRGLEFCGWLRGSRRGQDMTLALGNLPTFAWRAPLR